MDQLPSDTIILELQKQYYHGAPANTFDPIAPSKLQVLDCGIKLRNEVRFSAKYPNSFADIYYPAGEFSEKYPTIICLHGGGWFMGSRTSGDPLASAGGGIAKQNIMLAGQGYCVVSMDYYLSPEYRFPMQLLQINEGLGWFTNHAEEYHLNMDRVVIMGGSAGAVMAAQLGAAYSNPEYAKAVGVTPAVRLEQIRGISIDGAPMNSDWIDQGVSWMMQSWLGTVDLQGMEGKLLHVCQWVTENYPRTFLTAGNDGCFPEHTQELGNALRAVGVEVDDFYIDPAVSKQGHGYMGAWETDPYAKAGMERQLAFIRQVTAIDSV